MRKKIHIKASFLITIISCFTAINSYCQLTTISNSNNDHSQEFSNTAFNYLPHTTSNLPGQKTRSGEISAGPYLMLSDSMLNTTGKSDDDVAGNVASTNLDSLGTNDTVSLFANDADPVDSKEANANSITVTEFVAARAVKNEDGSTTLPAELSDKKIDRLINKYAEMISLEPEDVKNYPLYKFINDWYGVRYKWGGTDNSGIDCSAFSQKLYGKIYGTNIQRTARQQHRSCEKIKDYDDASEGDLVFFRIHHIRISHVGVYLANGYFVHASRSKGVVISNLEDKYWRTRYAGCGKISKADRPATESDFAQ